MKAVPSGLLGGVQARRPGGASALRAVLDAAPASRQVKRHTQRCPEFRPLGTMLRSAVSRVSPSTPTASPRKHPSGGLGTTGEAVPSTSRPARLHARQVDMP